MKHGFYKLIHKNLKNYVHTDQDKQIIQNLKHYAGRTTEQVLEELESDIGGLTDKEAIERLKKYGRNIVVHDKPKPWYWQLLSAFNNPFNYVLFILALVSILTGDASGTIIIVVMVLLSVSIKFTQEYKSGKGAEALKALVHTICNVTRDSGSGSRSSDRGDGNGSSGSGSTTREIPMEELVPGDIIQLAAGDIIPADVRLLHSKNLYVSQSALTGEAMSVEKGVDISTVPDNLLDIRNICFIGTNVDIGTATAIVIDTGTKTYFGSMAKSLVETKQQTSFDIGISKVSWLLIRFMLIMVPVIFFISGFTKGNWLDALLFALSVAVGLTPEMLPVIVTSNLAKGAMRMSKAKVIVKKLNAIQNFGAMNILCTDKTGTLTQDRITVVKHLDVFAKESQKVLEYAYLNSHFQSGLKNMMDMAILNNENLQDEDELVKSWKEVDELPFDFSRRRMSVILKQQDNTLMICKGAVEEILTCTSFVSTGTSEVPLNEELKSEIRKNAAGLNEEGLRVLVVAHRIFPDGRDNGYTVEDESNLVIDGFIAFLDPPKETAGKALEALKNNGIQLKVLTGDNEIITGKVCREIGLNYDRIITGSELDKFQDKDAIALIEKHQIFARLTPMQKGRIVTLLRKQGNTVGYIGDGINDAISLRESDIGITVDTAVDIAKENADMILLEKSLMVLNEGAVEGRKTFANTMKYIKITASSNFGNVFSMLGASILLPFLPMLPLQILVLNLLYDFSQVSITSDNVDKEYLTKPRKWIAGDIKRFMIIMGPSSSIFDYVTFAVLFFVIGANTVEQQGMFQTGWFIESLFTQILIVQVFRTEKIPFLQSRPSFLVCITAVLLLIIGVALPHTAVGKTIGFTILPLHFYFWLTAILAGYVIVAQLLKTWYIKRYHSWL